MIFSIAVILVTYNLHHLGNPVCGIQVVSSSKTETIEGEDAYLPCNYSGGNFSIHAISWTFRRQNIIRCGIGCSNTTDGRYAIVNKQNDHLIFLTVTDVNKGDAGNYTCLVSGGETYERILVELLVPSPPNDIFIRHGSKKLYVDGERTDIIMGTMQRFVCFAESLVQSPFHLTWKTSVDWWNYNFFHYTVQNSFRSSILIDLNVSRPLSSSLTCLLEVSDRTIRKIFLNNTIYIDVRGPPTITSNVQTKNLQEGMENFTLTCSQPTNMTKRPLQWSKYKDPKSAFDQSTLNKTGDQILHISKLQVEHSGIYTCTSPTSVGPVHDEIEIIVYYSPKIQDFGIRAEIQDGFQTLTMYCFCESYPKANVTWTDMWGNSFYDSTNLVAIDRRYTTNVNSSLVISEDSVRNHGIFSCNVRNHIGESRKSFDLSTLLKNDCIDVNSKSTAVADDGVSFPLAVVTAAIGIFTLCLYVLFVSIRLITKLRRRRNKRDKPRNVSSSGAQDWRTLPVIPTIPAPSEMPNMMNRQGSIDIPRQNIFLVNAPIGLAPSASALHLEEPIKNIHKQTIENSQQMSPKIEIIEHQQQQGRPDQVIEMGYEEINDVSRGTNHMPKKSKVIRLNKAAFSGTMQEDHSHTEYAELDTLKS